MQLYVYTFLAWEKYLVRTLWPRARAVSARPLETATAILSRTGRDADAFLFHVNLTNAHRVPADRGGLCDALRAYGVTVLNERVVDISRRHIHATCSALGLACAAAPVDGDPDEPLFLKTNRNYGGNPERRLSPMVGVALDSGPVAQTCRDWTDYRLIRRRDIGVTIHLEEGDVVERYIDNVRHVIFRLFVVRDHLVVSEVECRPVVVRKMEDAVSRIDHFCRFSEPDAHPAHIARLIGEAARFRLAVGFDYGTIDVLMDDAQRYWIIDVNPTPWSGASGQRADLAAHLRAGLAGA